MIRWLPNAITVVRLLLIPLFVSQFLGGRGGAAAATLGAIAASDWLDGWLARRWKVESRFGAFLDPLADKLTQIVALGLLAFREVEGVTPVPRALLALLLMRELLLAYGAARIRLRRPAVVIRPRWEGKASTVLVFALAFAACVGVAPQIVLALSLAAAPLIVLSAVRYTLDGRRQLAEASTPTRTARCEE